MSHFNKIRTFKPYLFKILFNIVLPPKSFSLIKVQWQEFVQYGCLIALPRSDFHDHLSVPDMIILISFVEG
jgi:hypothetical protein